MHGQHTQRVGTPVISGLCLSSISAERQCLGGLGRGCTRPDSPSTPAGREWCVADSSPLFASGRVQTCMHPAVRGDTIQQICLLMHHQKPHSPQTTAHCQLQQPTALLQMVSNTASAWVCAQQQGPYTRLYPAAPVSSTSALACKEAGGAWLGT